jgi:hypothetical protein
MKNVYQLITALLLVALMVGAVYGIGKVYRLVQTKYGVQR